MDRSKSILSASAYALYVHFVLQLVAGGILATVYRGSVAEAHATTAALHRGGWAILQGFHYWGSAVMILHSVLHFAAVTWAGWYKGPQVRGYFVAFALMGLSIGFQLTGNALSWDRHGVQTAAVEGAIANRIPVVGAAVAKATLGGDGVSSATLSLWYAAHRIALPLALVFALGLGLSVARGKGSKWTMALPAMAALLLAVVVASPFGSAATAADYGHFDARPSWYTMPMHGLLVWGDRLVPGGGWIGAMLLPGLVVLILLCLPFFKKPMPNLGRGLLIGFAALSGLAAITSGSKPALLVGTRDPKVRKRAIVSPSAETKNAVLAGKGRAIFSDRCAGCHGVDGKKALSGPALNDLWKEHSDASYYIRYVKKPSSVQPGSTMPAFEGVLKDEELREIAEFLRFPQ